MDKSGRKPLLMVSASGTFIGCFLTGISIYSKRTILVFLQKSKCQFCNLFIVTYMTVTGISHFLWTNSIMFGSKFGTDYSEEIYKMWVPALAFFGILVFTGSFSIGMGGFLG